MLILSEHECDAVDKAGETPARAFDAETGCTKVFLRSTDFDWLRTLVTDELDAPRALDPRTRECYALVPLERYERYKAFFEEVPITPREKNLMVASAGRRAGWDDPAFDIYDKPLENS